MCLWIIYDKSFPFDLQNVRHNPKNDSTKVEEGSYQELSDQASKVKVTQVAKEHEKNVCSNLEQLMTHCGNDEQSKITSIRS